MALRATSSSPKPSRIGLPPLWPSGPKNFYKAVAKHAPKILTGNMVCLDQATGTTSKPGYAVYKAGQLVGSGELTLNKRAKIGQRLAELQAQLQALMVTFEIDRPILLVIELLRGRLVHNYTHWAGGVAVAALNPEVVLEIPIKIWKAMAATDAAYAKGDEADARAFGQTLVCLAAGGRTDPGPAEIGRRKRAAGSRPFGVSRVWKPKRRKSRVAKPRAQRTRAGQLPKPRGTKR